MYGRDMTDRPIRVSLDLDPQLYAQLIQWATEATPKAGYRTKIPTSVVLRTCVELLITWNALQEAVITELLEH